MSGLMNWEREYITLGERQRDRKKIRDVGKRKSKYKKIKRTMQKGKMQPPDTHTLTRTKQSERQREECS